MGVHFMSFWEVVLNHLVGVFRMKLNSFFFNRSKSKNKTEINPIDEWHRPARDFANSVKFLKLDDSTDKLLNGLPINDLDMDEDRIDALFSEDNSVDLTADFKRVYTVGKVVG